MNLGHQSWGRWVEVNMVGVNMVGVIGVKVIKVGLESLVSGSLRWGSVGYWVGVTGVESLGWD